jgi:hypothetical protein
MMSPLIAFIGNVTFLSSYMILLTLFLVTLKLSLGESVDSKKYFAEKFTPQSKDESTDSARGLREGA